jgi:hypothetical protein
VKEKTMPDRVYRRKSKRETALRPTAIKLKGHSFQVNDISSEGIGIIVDDDAPGFFTGERLDKIPLPSTEKTLVIDGVVTHISVTTTGTVCGIRFLYKDDEFEALLQFKQERTAPSG